MLGMTPAQELPGAAVGPTAVVWRGLRPDRKSLLEKVFIRPDAQLQRPSPNTIYDYHIHVLRRNEQGKKQGPVLPHRSLTRESDTVSHLRVQQGIFQKHVSQPLSLVLTTY